MRRLCPWRIVLVATVTPGLELGMSGLALLLAHLHEPDTELARQLDQDADASQHVKSGENLSGSLVSVRLGSAMLDVVSVQTAK